MSFLGDMLNAMAERSRAILDFSSITETGSAVDQLQAICETLLSVRGESSALATASEALARYEALAPEARREFFLRLLVHFGPDMEGLREACARFAASADQVAAEALHRHSEPRRQKLFRLLNQANAGTAQLIAMRADLLGLLADEPELETVDRDFQHLFRSWFNRGFLELRRIDWNTPAAILERIIRYEAVHEIADWDDLRRRIDPPDRRLYAFFHPRLRDEPLIFVEVALMRSIATSIREILDPDRAGVPDGSFDTANFYSISDCQPGLRGISFGSFLIKQVVEELRQELPGVTRFATLSPLPRFAQWLDRQDVVAAGTAEGAILQGEAWWNDPDAAAALETPLVALAAWYVTRERDGRGKPLDPVARFHLGNGARVERINWMANAGPTGISTAHGIMVNYLYKLDEIERNHERYASGMNAAASAAVKRQATAGELLLERARGMKEQGVER